MENFIESRVILGLLCLIHAFAVYAGAGGAVQGHINKNGLKGFMLIELVVVTAYIVYDNLLTPPYNSWFVAILGYLLVYGLIFMTWASYGIYASLDKDKIYEMTISSQVRLMNKDYFGGTVIDGKHEIEVLLPYSSRLISPDETGKKQKVKFAEVLRGCYILVSPV